MVTRKGGVDDNDHDGYHPRHLQHANDDHPPVSTLVFTYPLTPSTAHHVLAAQYRSIRRGLGPAADPASAVESRGRCDDEDGAAGCDQEVRSGREG